MTIFWFRRDLRLHDNAGLYEALTASGEVLPIFIFDSNILDELPKHDARVMFISQLLDGMQSELTKMKRSLAVFHGDPATIFKKLIKENKVTAVYTNSDYEPYAVTRDAAIGKLLKKHGIDFFQYKDQVIFEKSEIVKSDGKPYIVYTPYSKQWKNRLAQADLKPHPSEKYLANFAAHRHSYLALEDIGFITSKIPIPKIKITKSFIDDYEKTRNFPSIETSRIGIHLRFGTVSIREMVRKADSSHYKTFLNELIWREFFMQILWHFPETVTKSFRAKYDNIKWRNNEVEFKAWCEGKTGYPIVDAGMRQLNAIGFMHNRVRMITSSFLCKHLLVDWRWGEAYFAEKLLDYEQSSNIGNWQWNAGSGVDAAPYFRIFNPEAQVEKFDKNYEYVKKWVPEFGTDQYPTKIVDHKEARERCLRVFKEAVR